MSDLVNPAFLSNKNIIKILIQHLYSSEESKNINLGYQYKDKKLVSYKTILPFITNSSSKLLS